MTLARKLIQRLLLDCDGASILETAFIVPLLLLLAMGAVDLGRAYCMAIEVTSAAHAGALYGVSNPTDASGMISAANLNAGGLQNLQTTAVYGCECSDGSSSVAECSYVPACPYNYVNYVSVTSTTTFAPLMKYPGIPGSFTLSHTSRLRAGGD